MTSLRGYTSIFLFISSLIFYSLLSCGNRLPPPGGPEDKAPPIIVESSPSLGDVGVGTAEKVSIVFDEKVDSESALKAIRLSPEHKDLKISVKGEKVELRPEDGLLPSTTYQVTVSNRLADERGNNFAGPFTFYFSTGDGLDKGLIRGKVDFRDKRARGAYVVAQALPESVSYFVQADSSGKYRLDHLPQKGFFLRSYLDQNGDEKYRFAVEPVDEQEVILLDEPLKIDFNLMVIDTSPPVLQSVEPVDSVMIKLIFDDPMHIETETLSAGAFQLFNEKDSTMMVPVVSADLDTTNTTTIFMRVSSPLEDGERYWLRLSGLKNERGLIGKPPDNMKKFTYYGR